MPSSKDNAITTSGNLDRSFFSRDVEQVAADLIGITFLVDGIGGTIVETEAYCKKDPASHSFKGLKPRNAAMFGPAGHAYVYFIYGMHWCVNFTRGDGSAILIRAIEPTSGLAAMAVRRGVTDKRLLCSGPGRLCKALGINARFDGLSLYQPPFCLTYSQPAPSVIRSERIGISLAKDSPRRFCATNSNYLSRSVSK